MSLLRVLHAVPDLEFGGLQRLVVQMTHLLDPARFDPHVLVLGSMGPLAEQMDAGRAHPATAQPRWSMLYPGALARQIAALRPDVVHTHSGVWYKSARAARMAGVRWIVHTDHGRMAPDPPVARFVDRLASRYTHVVAAVSEPLARALRERVVMHPERVRVVINGVDTDALRPGAARSLRDTLDIPAGVPIIGSIGRLEHIKGYDVMVEAFAELVRGLGAEARLVIAGDGACRPELEERARALGLDGAIRFLGWRSDAPALYATFDLFALTSRSEGTSVSLLEAMSAGLCPVVTDVGGNADVIGAELRHRLVPSGDPAAIAKGWLAALCDPDARRADGAAARARACERFSLRAMVERYEQIYEEGRAARA